MKKTIILSQGAEKEMSFEEVEKQFTPMMNKAVNVHIMKFGDNVDREDMLQEMRIEMWKAYEEYDGTHAFSTLLHYKLMKVTGNDSQKTTAKKRKSFGVLSMNSTVGDTEDLTLEDMFADEDYTCENMIASEMMGVINESLDEREKRELVCIIDPEYTVTQLANEMGMSRQACRQRVNKTKEKLQNILTAKQFVTV